MEILSLIVPALIALAVIILLASGYTKAPPDMAYIISGVRKKPRILIVTPEITYLPEGMGNLAGQMSAKAGGMADVSASLVAAGSR